MEALALLNCFLHSFCVLFSLKCDSTTQMKSSRSKPRKVAIALEMHWGHKRHQETYAGCLNYAHEAGWDCVITPNSERVLKPKKKEQPFDGILARATKTMAQTAGKQGIPIVNVWLNSPVPRVPSVLPDFKESGRIAAEHLMSRGFQRFGYLGYQRDLDAKRQCDGFRDALQSKGFSCTTHRFYRTSMEGNTIEWDNFRTGLLKWVESWSPPVGVLVSGDLYCRYLMEACHTIGLHVPQDAALIGTHNEPNICDSPSPTVTSIDMGFEEIGYRAASLLDHLMQGKRPPANPELIKPSKLVTRQSTDAFATEDSFVSNALRFMAENSHRPLSVKDVALSVGLNRRSLERRFNQYSPEGVARQITRMRIERAKRLIIETKGSLKSIAIDCGFRNSDHLSKAFKRTERLTPSQFRKLNGKSR